MQHRINTPEIGRWLRCADVTPRDSLLICTLNRDRTYALTDAYAYSPHIQFANSQTDDSLIDFVRAWGPLYLPNSQVPPGGVVSLRLSYLRARQGWIKAAIEMLSAFRKAKCEREALLGYAEAEYESVALSPDPVTNEPVSLMLLRNTFRIAGTITDWINCAKLSELRAATDFLIPLMPVHPAAVNLTCHRDGKRHIEANWTLSNLEEALRWMIWYDEFRKHPLMSCQECPKVFRAETAHTKKYCSHECAHRATARIWQRNKRAKQRAGRKSL